MMMPISAGSFSGSSRRWARRWTKPARWWTPVCRTARASTRSSPDRRRRACRPSANSAKAATLDELVEFGSLTGPIAEFLRGCVHRPHEYRRLPAVRVRQDYLLNALSGCIPEDERIVTIEDAAELRLAQDHVITLEASQPDRNGQGSVRFATWSATPCGCGRANRRRRVPGRRSAGHAPSHEHRP